MTRLSSLPRGLSAIAIALAATSLIGAAHAHSAYPTRPITFINPYAAGGPGDILGRIVSQKMSSLLGQPIIIEAKPGGGATIGAAYVARAPADGYTLLLGTAAAHIVTPMMQGVPYDGVKDFAFAAMVGNIPNVLTVHPGTGITSVQALIDISKASPDKLNYGSAGNGTSPHITGENFKLKTGAKLLHIPYKGAAPAATDMVSGAVQVGFINLPAVLPFIQDQRLKALAIAAAQRSPALPDVPTFAELGYDGFEGSSWYSLAAPAGTPQPILDKLRDALAKTLDDKQVQEQLAKQGVEGFLMDGKTATDFIQKDQQRIRALLDAAGLLSKK